MSQNTMYARSWRGRLAPGVFPCDACVCHRCSVLFASYTAADNSVVVATDSSAYHACTHMV